MKATLTVCDDSGNLLTRVDFDPAFERIFDFHHPFATPHLTKNRYLLWSARWVPVKSDDPIPVYALKGQNNNHAASMVGA